MVGIFSNTYPKNNLFLQFKIKYLSISKNYFLLKDLTLITNREL